MCHAAEVCTGRFCLCLLLEHSSQLLITQLLEHSSQLLIGPAHSRTIWATICGQFIQNNEANRSRILIQRKLTSLPFFALHPTNFFATRCVTDEADDVAMLLRTYLEEWEYKWHVKNIPKTTRIALDISSRRRLVS